MESWVDPLPPQWQFLLLWKMNPWDFFWVLVGGFLVSLVSTWERWKGSLWCVHKLDGYGDGVEQEEKKDSGKRICTVKDEQERAACSWSRNGNLCSLPALGSVVLLSLGPSRGCWKSRSCPCGETEDSGKKNKRSVLHSSSLPGILVCNESCLYSIALSENSLGTMA